MANKLEVRIVEESNGTYTLYNILAGDHGKAANMDKEQLRIAMQRLLDAYLA